MLLVAFHLRGCRFLVGFIVAAREDLQLIALPADPGVPAPTRPKGLQKSNWTTLVVNFSGNLFIVSFHLIRGLAGISKSLLKVVDLKKAQYLEAMKDRGALTLSFRMITMFNVVINTFDLVLDLCPYE